MTGSLPTKKTIICLLRNDLRYMDNEALFWAHKNGDYVVPVYCFDPRHFAGTYHFGFPKCGPHRTKFLLESVIDLRKNLQSHGSGLVVRKGKPEEVLPDLIQKLGANKNDGVVFQEEVCSEELDVEKSLKKNCIPLNIKTIWGATLFHKDDIPYKTHQVPDIYTEFRKGVESRSVVRTCIEMPSQLQPLPAGLEEGDMPTVTELCGQEAEFDSRTAFPFSGGENEALSRIQHYFWATDKVAEYKETRNGMIAADYSTKFSPWLAHGCISPRYIYWEVKRYEEQRTANKSTYWVIFEMIWRDYFRYVALKFGNKLFFRDGIQGKAKPWKQDTNLFNAWKKGATGVPFVDANMRELERTGFMSNRGRQNVASFLCKDLQLDWRLGAEWFESMLVDHDVCSNYGNWLYSAGLGNDPREDRKFNMIKQGLDYDPDGEYIRLWVTELTGLNGKVVHAPWALGRGLLERSGVKLGESYPNPIVIAPEWSRHLKQSSEQGGATRGDRKGHGHQRGLDFYFKGSNSGK